MKRCLSSFFKNESGAVTVDWVVITAAVVGLAMAVTSIINTSTLNLSGEIASTVEAERVKLSTK